VRGAVRRKWEGIKTLRLKNIYLVYGYNPAEAKQPPRRLFFF